MAGTAVFGIYKTRRHVENAVEELKCSGFLNTDISVLLPDEDGGQDLRHQKHTKAPEGATSGVVAGGALGGTLGWLAGIGAVAIPGVGHLIAAGPILGALSGAAVAGALGAIAGALIGLGIPE